MSVKPVLSVIIPVYNAERTLRTAIDSVLMQRCDDVEIVVVDDGSTDGSWEIIESYGDRVVGIRQENAGASTARNIGIEHSRSEYIKFLDADDYLLPECLDAQIKAAGAASSGTIIYGATISWDEKTGSVKKISDIGHHNHRNGASWRLYAAPPAIAAILYPRSAIADVGGLLPNVTIYDDIFLFARCAIYGHCAKQTHIPMFVYRQHANSGRMSYRRSAKDFNSAYHGFSVIYREIVESNRRHDLDHVALGLARLCWGAAREAARHHHISLALDMFALARNMHPRCVLGSFPYRILASFLGPVRTEAINLRLKHISTRTNGAQRF